MTTEAYSQIDVFDAAKLFLRTEGIIPAPEPSHAIKGAIDEALRCKKTGEAKTILFVLCGHGYFDMAAYDEYFSGNFNHTNTQHRKLQSQWINFTSSIHG